MYFTDSTIELIDFEAEAVYIKGENQSASRHEFISGTCKIDTDGYPAGNYHLQFVRGKEILRTDKILLRQNLATAPADYDARSYAEKTLDAIDAFMASQASTTQRRWKLGDKEVENSSFEELQRWRNYYYKIVLQEQGKPLQPDAELLILHRY